MPAVTDLSTPNASDQHYELVPDRSTVRARPRRDPECCCGDFYEAGERDGLQARKKLVPHREHRGVSPRITT